MDSSHAIATAEHEPTTVPVPIASPRELLPWVLFVGLLGIILMYFVGAEQGATHVFSGMGVHEFVHDARHLLGFPCH